MSSPSSSSPSSYTTTVSSLLQSSPLLLFSLPYRMGTTTAGCHQLLLGFFLWLNLVLFLLVSFFPKRGPAPLLLKPLLCCCFCLYCPIPRNTLCMSLCCLPLCCLLLTCCPITRLEEVCNPKLYIFLGDGSGGPPGLSLFMLKMNYIN